MQLIVVLSQNWDVNQANLYRFEKTSTNEPWRQVGRDVRVFLGVNGLSEYKAEGDGKSPAGIFSLGTVFGDHRHQVYASKMPYLLITEDLECVDDSDSRFYNCFVDKNTLPRDWKSSEKMQNIGDVYHLGLVIRYNCQPIVAGAGSCIFMHISSGTGTAGCTALLRQDLIELVTWLDAAQNPMLVQLPYSEYYIKEKEWGLPSLVKTNKINFVLKNGI